jgi:hypothetical protein
MIKYGTAIMVLHDFSDPWMECAKLFNYLRITSGSNIAFSIFALSFFYLRVWVFPRYIIKATLYWRPFSLIFIRSDYARPAGYQYYWITFASLSGLWVLHCFWSYLITKVFLNSIWTQKDADADPREEEG